MQLPKEQEHYNPYVLTIFKVIRIYMKSAKINYKEILKWLNCLNPNELPEEVFKFQDVKGKEREKASKKNSFINTKQKH